MTKYKDEDFFKIKPRYRNPKTLPISDEWQEKINDNWWSSKNQWTPTSLQKEAPYHNTNDLANTLKLREKLYLLGGQEACMPLYDIDHEKLLTRGIAFGGKSKSMKGLPSQCHKNSCNLWENNKDVTRICTGYALSNDGMWREHSWLINIKPDNSYQIIETTVKRKAYFGYIMTYEECKIFSEENY